MYILSLVYWQLLLYGVHVGHSFANSIVFSGWLVYTFRQIILIINLFKTTLSFKNGYAGINQAVNFSGPVWFINLHRSVELYVNYFAKQCGEFCYSTYWINGLISNWISLANTFRKLFRMVTGSHKGQFSKLELESSPWFMGRWSWPRVTLVSSVSTSPHPTKECSYLGIPCIGIVDTDISGHIANIATPGNDDSLDCIVLYNTHISQYILEKKYGLISGWFIKIRKAKRFFKFKEWVFLNYMNKAGKINLGKISKRKKNLYDVKKSLNEDLSFKFNINNLFYGLRFYFSKNFGLNKAKEQVDLYEPDDFIKKTYFDFKKLIYFYKKSFVFLSKTLNYYFIKCSWMLYIYIKKYNLSLKVFNLRFLTGIYYKRYYTNKMFMNFFFVRFIKNRIYKTFLRRNKYRFNLFVLKFVKFFYIKKYTYFRSTLMDLYSCNFTKISSFAYISMSYCSFLFVDTLIVPLIRYSNSFLTHSKLKKVNYFVKWHFFKQGIENHLKSLINNNKINKYLKFLLSYKGSILLQKIMHKKVKKLYIFIYFYFNFISWNRFKFRKYEFYSKTLIYKNWLLLKNMRKNLIYLDLFQQSLYSFNKFKFLFNKLNFIKNNLNLLNNKLSIYFNLFCRYYKKSLYSNNFFQYYHSTLFSKIKKQFRYTRKKNLRFRKGNKVIFRLETEFGKFKHLKNREQDQYKQVYLFNRYLRKLKFKGKKFSSYRYVKWFFRKTIYFKGLKRYFLIKKFFYNHFFNNENRNIYYNYIYIDVEPLDYIKNRYLLNFYNTGLIYKNLIKNTLFLNIFIYFNNKILSVYEKNTNLFFFSFRNKRKYLLYYKKRKKNYLKFLKTLSIKNKIFKKKKYWLYNIINLSYPFYFYITFKGHTFNLINLRKIIFKRIKNKYYGYKRRSLIKRKKRFIFIKTKILNEKNQKYKYIKIYSYNNKKLNVKYVYYNNKKLKAIKRKIIKKNKRLIYNNLIRLFSFYNKYLKVYYKQKLLSF